MSHARLSSTARSFGTAAADVDEGLDGQYLLSNGSSLEVTPFGDAIRVSFGPGATLVLRPDGKGSFVSRDGQITLRYERARAGGLGKLSVSQPPGEL